MTTEERKEMQHGIIQMAEYTTSHTKDLNKVLAAYLTIFEELSDEALEQIHADQTDWLEEINSKYRD